MTQEERRIWLIRELLAEDGRFGWKLPTGEQAQKDLLRALMNVRPPKPIGADFLAVQDAYLAEEVRRQGVADGARLPAFPPGGNIRLWQGDITALRCDAIVNAANSGMTGCYRPLHSCVDNLIHSKAGIQLRLACAALMEAQGGPEPPGRAKITPAFCLPCRWVLHTVGPVVQGDVTAEDEALLAGCYRSCLALAREKGLKSVAFCCISTGVFCFPRERAAAIAVRTVREQMAQDDRMEVIFVVHSRENYDIYRKLLGDAGASA